MYPISRPRCSTKNAIRRYHRIKFKAGRKTASTGDSRHKLHKVVPCSDAMKWSFKPAFKNFESARSDWDTLNRSQHNHILLDSGFVAPLLRYFGSRDVLLGANTNSKRPGMVLLRRKLAGCWETFQPGQAPLGLFVPGSAEEPAAYFPEMLSGLPASAMQLAVLQQDSDFSPLTRELAGPTLEVLDFIETPRVLVEGTFEDFWATRNNDLRQNLVRRMRRLEKQGRRLELVTIKEPCAVADAIREYGRIEASGWKGREGSAITEDNDQAHFYREVIEHFCERGEGCIFQLRLDGQIIGSELYISREGMLVGLKTTFDEAMREISPGFLMKYLIIRQVYAENQTRTIEFYGRVKDWHSKWATHIRPMYHFNYFRNRLARKAREILKRFA